MAATLAGVCQVPLTAVLLLFELTQDYRIVLPLLGAVGLSSWITSGQAKRKDVGDPKKRNLSSPDPSVSSSRYPVAAKESYASNLCEVESSLCVNDSNSDTQELEKRIFVSQAMRTRFVTVLMSTLLTETVSLMLEEKQTCAVIIDDDHLLIGLLTLEDIQAFSEREKARIKRSKVFHPTFNYFLTLELIFKHSVVLNLVEIECTSKFQFEIQVQFLMREKKINNEISPV